MISSSKQLDIGRITFAKEGQYRREVSHVSPRHDGKPDGVHILLNGGVDDHLGRLAQAEIDHLEAGVAQRSGNDLHPTVVPIQTWFGYQDSQLAGRLCRTLSS